MQLIRAQHWNYEQAERGLHLGFIILAASAFLLLTVAGLAFAGGNFC